MGTRVIPGRQTLVVSRAQWRRWRLPMYQQTAEQAAVADGFEQPTRAGLAHEDQDGARGGHRSSAARVASVESRDRTSSQ